MISSRLLLLNQTKMKALVFLTFAAFASANTLLGNERCSWGPSYWCSHISKAEECGAVEHCAQAVWTKQKYTKVPNAECELCELILNVTRKYLEQQSVRQNIIKYATELCNFTSSIPQMKQECDQILPYLPTILNLLANKNMTSAVICSFVVKGCSADQTQEQQKTDIESNELTPSKPVAKTQKICTDCEAFFGDIKDLITDNNTESQVILMVKQLLCAQLGQFEGMCDQLVDQYVPQLLSMAASYVDPDVTCQSLGFCTAGDPERVYLNYYLKHPTFFKILNYIVQYVGKDLKSGYSGMMGCIKCSACETGIAGLRSLVVDQTFVNLVTDFLKNDVCSELGQFSAECKKEVEQNIPVIFRIMFNSFLDPPYICSSLKMCPAISPNLERKNVGSVECDVCTDAMKAVENFVTSTTVQQAIVAYLQKQVCTKLGSLEEECKQEITQYAASFFKMIANVLQPDFVCYHLSLCKSSKNVVLPKLADNPPQCTICEKIIQEAQKLLTDGRTESAIKSALDKVCSLLPSEYATECTNLVQKYEAELLSLLAADIDPKLVCVKLKLCTTQSVKAKPLAVEKPKSLKANVTCILCEFVMRELDGLLAKNASEKEIIDALDKVCSIMPNSIKTECTAFVGQYAKAIIQLLLQELTPAQVCTELKLCASANRKAAPRLHHVPLRKMALTSVNIIKPVETPKKNSEYCDLCHLVVTELEKMITDKSTKDEIRSALYKVCDKLPDNLITQCETLVNEYEKYLIDALVQKMDASVICAKIGLCPESNAVVKQAVKKTDCELCTVVITELDKLITDKSSQAEIKAALDQVCSYLPGTLNTDCKNMVDKYLTEILELLAQEMSPEEICKEIGMCSAFRAKVKASSAECVICEELLLYVQEGLKENKTIAYLKWALEYACNEIPSNMQEECRNLVSEYGTQFALFLSREVKPNMMCEKFLGCTSAKERNLFKNTVRNVKEALQVKDTKLYFRKHLLGAEKCHNPMYYCHSERNAKLCGVDFRVCNRLNRMEKIIKGL